MFNCYKINHSLTFINVSITGCFEYLVIPNCLTLKDNILRAEISPYRELRTSKKKPTCSKGKEARIVG